MFERLGDIIKRRSTEQHTNSGSEVPSEQIPQLPVCRLCDDFGFIYPRTEEGKVNWSKVVSCSCQAERITTEARGRLLRYCDLPQGSESQTLGYFDPGPYASLQLALRAARAIAEGSDQVKWLTLTGPRDLGKSHLAIGVCREWLSRGRPAKYVFVPILLDWLRASMDEPELSLTSRMRILQEVPLLVMDDLGVQKPTPWAMERLMTIIDYRYSNNLSLMVTTNKPLDELPGDDEGRIGSRLRRFVPGKVILMEGPEYITRRGKP